MAEDGQSTDDRTEAATPKRLERARDEGNVPVSREATTLASLAAVTLALAWFGGTTGRDMVPRLTVFLAHADTASLAGPDGMRIAGTALLRGIAPFALAAVLGGGGAVLLQTRFLLHGGALQPKLGRLDPRAGLKRLLSLDSLADTLRSIVKIGVISLALWRVVLGDMTALARLPYQDPMLLPARIVPPLLHVALVVLAAQVVVAAADILWVHLRHARRMRMTRQDIREEQKESDGDPKIKARIRQIRQQRARRRMIASVPKATVVVTNPTHYAVALGYDRTKNAAPRIVAKGVDSMAARIREVAEANNIPMVANPPLARALYRVEVDAEIPAEHYQAVAELIAYVWRLARTSGQRVP
jgi:flagellar biosynthesis protein FlhB